MTLRRCAAGVALACAAASLSACTEVESSSSEGYHPASLTAIEGSDIQLVTFTAEGARRAGVRTALVRRRGGHEVVPYAALLYDGEGRPWVYRTAGNLSFVRTPVRVDRIAGGRVLLDRGPRPGSRVVTQGATEVYGAELDIAGDH